MKLERFELRKLKPWTIKIGSGKTPSGGADSYVDYGITFLRSQNIHFHGIQLGDVVFISSKVDEEMSSTRVREGDVLLNITGASLGRATYVPKGFPRANVNQHVCIIRPSQELESRFLAACIASDLVQRQIFSLQVGGNRDGLNFDQVAGLRIPMAPIEEQGRIADFLDAETSRVNAMASARRQQIKLLTERYQSCIYSAIARFSSPFLELRRFGVTVTTGPFGTMFAATEYQSNGIPMINPIHIINGRIVPDSAHSVSRATALKLVRHQLQAGDIIVGRKGDLGRAAIVQMAQHGWICGSDCIALHSTPDGLAPRFLELVLQSDHVRSQLLACSLATTMPSLNEGNLLSLRVPQLSLECQNRITYELDTKREWTERTVTAMKAQEALLAERRRTLITAAVTGQFDVSTASGRGIEG